MWHSWIHQLLSEIIQLIYLNSVKNIYQLINVTSFGIIIQDKRFKMSIITLILIDFLFYEIIIFSPLKYDFSSEAVYLAFLASFIIFFFFLNFWRWTVSFSLKKINKQINNIPLSQEFLMMLSIYSSFIGGCCLFLMLIV